MRHLARLVALVVLSLPTLSVAPTAFAQEPSASREATRLYVEAAIEEALGNDREAYRLYHHAYLIDPEAPSIHFAMARVAVREGDMRLGVDHLRSTIRLDEENQPAHLLLGTVLELMSRSDEARPHLERAAELDTLDAGAALALARHYERAREPERALVYYLRARELDPGDDENLLRIATLLGQLGRFAEAEPYLERLRESDPDNPTLSLTWAWVQDELGRPEAAVEAYEEHLRLFPADAVARRRLVNALVRIERPGEAEPHAALLYEQAHGVAEARVLAGIYLNTGDTAAARDLALEVRGQEPGNAEAGEMALQTLARCGDDDLGVREMERLTQENPGEYRTWILLCVAQETAGRRPDALTALAQAEQVAPADSLDALLDLADGYSRLERPRDAERLLERARKLDREPARVWYALASVRERAQDFDGAESAIRRVLEVEPESPQALNFLGYLYADQNRNLEEAVRLIKRALAQQPENGFIVDSLGWAYYRLGELDSARVELERAIRLSGEDPVILEHLGDVELADGDRDAAYESYRRALELDPDNEPLRQKMERSR